jgi:enoyl-CoA hydratase/carnithine racemase
MMDTFETITCKLAGPVATVTLNRPDARNAMSHRMIDELLRCFTTLRGPAHTDVRAVVLRAAGTVFCAGGDLRDLSDTAGSPEAASAVTARTDELLRAVNEAPQVVIARVQGPAVGGGLGLVCVSDLAIAAESARFAFNEVRLGLVPSVISPYVVARIGFTQARRLMLTGVRIGAAEAREIGLVHDACLDEDLDELVDAAVRDVLQCGPQALRACKALLFHVAATPPADTLTYRVDLLNRLRASDEAGQGMRAFLQKRPAPWVPQTNQTEGTHE